MYLFQISGELPDLAKAEIKNLLKVNISQFENNFLCVDQKLNKNLFERLAYTKKIYFLLDKNKDISLIDFKSHIKKSYKLDVKNNSENICDYVYQKLDNPEVEIKNPKHKYLIYFSDKKFFLFEEIFENKDSPSTRRAHLREELHPTSLHPKQARAMINLVAQKEFMDPFCGTGGILIEGALMNLKVIAKDISQIMINRSKINLGNLISKVDLEVKDALNLDQEVECIVTDFPFGKNSFKSEDIQSLFQKFMVVAQKITSNLVVGHLDNLDVSSAIKNTSWKIDQSFEIYVHKSMKRKITKFIQN